MPSSKEFIGNLRKFNRKERYHLINSLFGLNKLPIVNEYKKQIEKIIGQELLYPYVATDYHIDSLCASLYMTYNGVLNSNNGLQMLLDENGSLAFFEADSDQEICGSQQDFDMLIACQDFKNSNRSKLLLIEAKFTSKWSDQKAAKQLSKKINRIEKIFFRDGKKRWPDIDVHLAIAGACSSMPPISTGGYLVPAIESLPYISLQTDSSYLKVSRCDEHHKICSNGRCRVIRHR